MKKPDLNKPIFQIFPEFAKVIQKDQCPFCDKNITESDFRDELSKREFSISGLCQDCQDKAFGV